MEPKSRGSQTETTISQTARSLQVGYRPMHEKKKHKYTNSKCASM